MEWEPYGPADDRFFDAEWIVRQIDTYVQNHPGSVSEYAEHKIPRLQEDLRDIFYRQRRGLASIPLLLESARSVVAILQGYFRPEDE